MQCVVWVECSICNKSLCWGSDSFKYYILSISTYAIPQSAPSRTIVLISWEWTTSLQCAVYQWHLRFMYKLSTSIQILLQYLLWIFHICRIYFQHRYQCGLSAVLFELLPDSNFQFHSLTSQDEDSLQGRHQMAVLANINPQKFLVTFVLVYSIQIVIHHNARIVVSWWNFQPQHFSWIPE